mgnify:CR=1 FL=1
MGFWFKSLVWKIFFGILKSLHTKFLYAISQIIFQINSFQLQFLISKNAVDPFSARILQLDLLDPIISLIKVTATNGSMLFDLNEIQFVIFYLLCLDVRKESAISEKKFWLQEVNPWWKSNKKIFVGVKEPGSSSAYSCLWLIKLTYCNKRYLSFWKHWKQVNPHMK